MLSLQIQEAMCDSLHHHPVKYNKWLTIRILSYNMSKHIQWYAAGDTADAHYILQWWQNLQQMGMYGMGKTSEYCIFKNIIFIPK